MRYDPSIGKQIYSRFLSESASDIYLNQGWIYNTNNLQNQTAHNIHNHFDYDGYEPIATRTDWLIDWLIIVQSHTKHSHGCKPPMSSGFIHWTPLLPYLINGKLYSVPFSTHLWLVAGKWILLVINRRHFPNRIFCNSFVLLCEERWRS